jgi:hypothetical protein
LKRLHEELKKRCENVDPERVAQRCDRIVGRGCTNPAIPGQEIILRYVDPLGQTTYRTVTTDENGCFEDIFVSITGGTW